MLSTRCVCVSLCLSLYYISLFGQVMHRTTRTHTCDTHTHVTPVCARGKAMKMGIAHDDLSSSPPAKGVSP